MRRRPFSGAAASGMPVARAVGTARLLVALSASLSAGPGIAVVVVNVGGDGGETVGMLRESYDFHMERVSSVVKANASTLTTQDLERLANRWMRATVARFEYTYVTGRRSSTVVYHALSGREATEILGVQGSSIEHEVTRHTVHRPVSAIRMPGSQLVLPAEGHLLDAEVKGLRALERDIRGGVIPGGGRLKVWASQPVCASCRALVDSFESTLAIDTTIYQWQHAGSGAEAAPFRQLSEHRRRGAARLKTWRKDPTSLAGKETVLRCIL